jgi:NAD(P)-dependent dehydrogenase (short-subunit alcohol dehydrogenase family)
MKVLVVGVDSGIGAAIAQRHSALGDVVETTSRNGKGTYALELAHPQMWPRLENNTYDMVYYCIGIGDGRSTRMEVMQVNAFSTWDYLNTIVRTVKPGGKIVVLSSGWGSIGELRSAKSPMYRMSKAALNMGVACLAQRYLTHTWVLMNPGMVRTKLTTNLQTSATHEMDFIDPHTSAVGVVNAASKVTDHFSFVDYNGAVVPF